MFQQGNIHALPIVHYNMEMAAEVRCAYLELQPDCVAVELAETMQLQLLHAASRLPDISVVVTNGPLYYLSEPCEPAFEGLRSALEDQKPAFCIDLDVLDYQDFHQNLPDPYAITKIGLKYYYETYSKIVLSNDNTRSELDKTRELYMAKRLKELSFSYDRILFVCGMYHLEKVLELVNETSFPPLQPAERNQIEVCTLTEKSCREVMAEPAWFTCRYEDFRKKPTEEMIDRQKLLYKLYQAAIPPYEENSGFPFANYHMRNLMKFVRNYSLYTQKLMPDLFQLLTAAKGCVDHNYAYEVWELATEYPFLKNVDQLPELDLTAEQVWGQSQRIQLHRREKQKRKSFFSNKRKDRTQVRFEPASPFSLCSHQPEDIIVENFGEFLRKKGTQLVLEEGARTIPFSTSLEDGIDTKETIRHWPEKKLYVKVAGKPPGGVGSIVVIFDDDKKTHEKFPYKMTWLGEHDQESDMAFYSTPIAQNIVGPGISRCEYGGMMLSYPPRRMFNVWQDPDYEDIKCKSEILLMAAIDYSVKPLITYVAAQPPRPKLKNYARRFGKKVVYIPIGQLSPVTLNKIKIFHVLDGHDKRRIADEYI